MRSVSVLNASSTSSASSQIRLDTATSEFSGAALLSHALACGVSPVSLLDLRIAPEAPPKAPANLTVPAVRSVTKPRPKSS